MQSKLLLLSIVGVLAACGGQPSSDEDAGGAADSGKPPVSGAPSGGSPVQEKGRVTWNDQQGACLDKTGAAGYNNSANGKDAQCVDFSNQDLTNKDFSNYDLRGANFHNAVLVGAKFDGAQMKGLVLTGAEVESPCVLNWLASGTMPADKCKAPVAVAPALAPAPVAQQPVPVPAPVPAVVVAPAPAPATEDRVPASVDTPPIAANPAPEPAPTSPAPVPVVETPPPPIVPVIVETPASPTADVPPPTIIDINAILAQVRHVQDVPAYLNQVTSTAEQESMRSHLRLKGLRMQRWAQQAMVRIDSSILRDDNADLNKVKASDPNAVPQYQSVVDKTAGETEAFKIKVEDLINQINQADSEYHQ